MEYNPRPWLFGLTVIAAGGCGRKPTPPSPEPASIETPQPPARTVPMPRSNLADAQAARERLERERLEREAADREVMMRTLRTSLHFAYDRSDLSEESRVRLDAKTRILAARPEIRLRIVGYTDDRGSDEYNQALGQRRAAAAHRYLVQRGIADARLEYVSMGEGRPLCPESTEVCRAENRRAEFELIHE